MPDALGRMVSDILQVRVSSVEGLADACAHFHDFPFELQAQHFDAGSRTWTAFFMRGSSDPARVTSRRWLGLVKVLEFPIVEVRVTIRNVIEAEIQDRAQIGAYTFHDVYRTSSGCRFEFHQDCDITIHVDGPFDADIRDVRELTDRHGRITSLGLLDFGIQVAPVRQPELEDFL
jgi:hypothetical protein